MINRNQSLNLAPNINHLNGELIGLNNRLKSFHKRDIFQVSNLNMKSSQMTFFFKEEINSIILYYAKQMIIQRIL